MTSKSKPDISVRADTCSDCDRPLATNADGDMSCDEPCKHCESLCWREFHGGECESPIDWRARALASESLVKQYQLVEDRGILDVTAERDQLKAEVERLRSKVDEAIEIGLRSHDGCHAIFAQVDQLKRDLAEALDGWESWTKPALWRPAATDELRARIAALREKTK